MDRLSYVDSRPVSGSFLTLDKVFVPLYLAEPDPDLDGIPEKDPQGLFPPKRLPVVWRVWRS